METDFNILQEIDRFFKERDGTEQLNIVDRIRLGEIIQDILSYNFDNSKDYQNLLRTLEAKFSLSKNQSRPNFIYLKFNTGKTTERNSDIKDDEVVDLWDLISFIEEYKESNQNINPQKLADLIINRDILTNKFSKDSIESFLYNYNGYPDNNSVDIIANFCYKLQENNKFTLEKYDDLEKRPYFAKIVSSFVKLATNTELTKINNLGELLTIMHFLYLVDYYCKDDALISSIRNLTKEYHIRDYVKNEIFFQQNLRNILYYCNNNRNVKLEDITKNLIEVYDGTCQSQDIINAIFYQDKVNELTNKSNKIINLYKNSINDFIDELNHQNLIEQNEGFLNDTLNGVLIQYTLNRSVYEIFNSANEPDITNIKKEIQKFSENIKKLIKINGINNYGIFLNFPELIKHSYDPLVVDKFNNLLSTEGVIETLQEELGNVSENIGTFYSSKEWFVYMAPYIGARLAKTAENEKLNSAFIRTFFGDAENLYDRFSRISKKMPAILGKVGDDPYLLPQQPSTKTYFFPNHAIPPKVMQALLDNYNDALSNEANIATLLDKIIEEENKKVDGGPVRTRQQLNPASEETGSNITEKIIEIFCNQDLIRKESNEIIKEIRKGLIDLLYNEYGKKIENPDTKIPNNIPNQNGNPNPNSNLNPNNNIIISEVKFDLFPAKETGARTETPKTELETEIKTTFKNFGDIISEDLKNKTDNPSTSILDVCKKYIETHQSNGINDGISPPEMKIISQRVNNIKKIRDEMLDAYKKQDNYTNDKIDKEQLKEIKKEAKILDSDENKTKKLINEICDNALTKHKILPNELIENSGEDAVEQNETTKQKEFTDDQIVAAQKLYAINEIRNKEDALEGDKALLFKRTKTEFESENGKETKTLVLMKNELLGDSFALKFSNIPLDQPYEPLIVRMRDDLPGLMEELTRKKPPEFSIVKLEKNGEKRVGPCIKTDGNFSYTNESEPSATKTLLASFIKKVNENYGVNERSSDHDIS